VTPDRRGFLTDDKPGKAALSANSAMSSRDEDWQGQSEQLRGEMQYRPVNLFVR